jgi:hypothetical protein
MSKQIDLRDDLHRRSAVESLTEPAQAADLATESLRWLNHLLGRFASASEVYAVVASLAYCLEVMPQALEGLTEYLLRQQAAGQLRRDDGGDVLERVTTAGAAAAEAGDVLATAAAALRDAHNALADVAGPIDEPEAHR